MFMESRSSEVEPKLTGNEQKVRQIEITKKIEATKDILSHQLEGREEGRNKTYQGNACPPDWARTGLEPDASPPD